MKSNRNEDAVSPVIGVILMVAITVILAAVIATFTLGMTDDVDTSKSVAATAKQIGEENITVTYFGGQDAGDVSGLRITAGDESSVVISPSVGQQVKFTSGTSGKDSVIVVAVFTDGSEQVIYDAYV